MRMKKLMLTALAASAREPDHGQRDPPQAEDRLQEASHPVTHGLTPSST